MTVQLESYKKIIEKELGLFFDTKLEKAKYISPSSVEMIKLLRDYNLRGGKRVRAAMLYYGYRCFSNKNLKEIIKASISIELIQSFLLIHDDIIDRSDLRRNSLTLHKSYEKLAKKIYPGSDHYHFGISMSLIAGDILAAFANEILTRLDIKEKNKINAIRRLNHVIHEVIYGQALDILSGLKPITKITKKDLEQIHYLKTASYTIEGPLHIGALLAGAKTSQLKILSQYAVPLGKAFQIHDDILGLFGDEKKLGKPVDSDLKEGKKTLLILKALEKADKHQRQTIEKALGNPKLTNSQLKHVQYIIKRTGSLEFSQRLAKNLIIKAKTIIKKSDFKPKGKDFLINIADYMLDRDV